MSIIRAFDVLWRCWKEALPWQFVIITTSLKSLLLVPGSGNDCIADVRVYLPVFELAPMLTCHSLVVSRKLRTVMNCEAWCDRTLGMKFTSYLLTWLCFAVCLIYFTWFNILVLVARRCTWLSIAYKSASEMVGTHSVEVFAIPFASRLVHCVMAPSSWSALEHHFLLFAATLSVFLCYSHYILKYHERAQGIWGTAM